MKLSREIITEFSDLRSFDLDRFHCKRHPVFYLLLIRETLILLYQVRIPRYCLMSGTRTFQYPLHFLKREARKSLSSS